MVFARVSPENPGVAFQLFKDKDALLMAVPNPITFGAIRVEELQSVRMMSPTWMSEDAMCLPENGFIETPLNGEEVHRYFEELSVLSPPMYDDQSEDDAPAYFADGEESYAEEEDEDWNSMTPNVGDSDYCNGDIDD
jgi:hypothetical protein